MALGWLVGQVRFRPKPGLPLSDPEGLAPAVKPFEVEFERLRQINCLSRVGDILTNYLAELSSFDRGHSYKLSGRAQLGN